MRTISFPEHSLPLVSVKKLTSRSECSGNETKAYPFRDIFPKNWQELTGLAIISYFLGEGVYLV